MAYFICYTHNMNEQELASVRMFEKKAAKAAIETSSDYKAETKRKREYSRSLLARISLLETQDAA